jgi:DNA-binding response OmpR family regulator
MKIQFFANISHEFRTPLSLILPPLKQIIDNESLKNEVKKRLEMVFRNANRLFGLVNELMDFTKSEEKRLKMMVQEVDIILFAREIHSMFVEEAKRRSIDFRFETEFDSMEAWFDKSKMEKIINNLLSNAFKFTSDHGNITLKIDNETDNDQSFITISTIDNGSGIAQEYISKVFDRFFQSPEEEKKHVGGTGIGLALVKSLVELHHGTISVTSKKWEKTCFTVKIPSGNTHFNKNEILAESGEYFLSSDTSLPGERKKEFSKPDGNAPILLIVEDNSELREYLVSILSPKYQVLEAADGVEGVKIALESIPDLILSDIVMPRLSGIELCKKIKNEMATSHIPVIMLTSNASTPEIIEGIGTGADAYITKPFDILHLEVTIEKTIETRRKLYQRFSQDVYMMPNENTDNELDKKFLESVIGYVDKNVSNEDITVESLAAHLLMSRTNVYRKIKALTGQSATEFIRLVRLKMAIKLLETGKYHISEIAYKVGFTSPSYFTKCFKDQYGKSPSEFIVTKIKKD